MEMHYFNDLDFSVSGLIPSETLYFYGTCHDALNVVIAVPVSKLITAWMYITVNKWLLRICLRL